MAKAAAKKAATKKATRPASKKAAQVAARATDDQRAFLADIVANPDDKKARLVYADLLQDSGNPRGDFIILQCTRAELAADDPRIEGIDTQIAELLKKHKKVWTAFGEAKGARWEYRRGFVEKLSIDAQDLVTHGATILANEPIEELNVWKIDESSHAVGNSRLAAVLALPLRRVKRLSLARCKLVKEDFQALASATNLGNVELLDLTNGGSFEIPLGPLADAKLPKLRELRITGCMCGDKAMAALAKAKHLRFTRLLAGRNDLGVEGCAAIADATWAPDLEFLDLSSNEDIRDEGLRALAESTNLGALRTLDLEFTGLYEQGAEIILGSPVFGQLERLCVYENALDTDKLEPVFGARLQRI